MKNVWTFDGHGINGGDEYMSRIATLTEHGQDLGAGKLLAAAPDLLAALESLTIYFRPFLGQGCCDAEFAAAIEAIAKAKGK